MMYFENTLLHYFLGLYYRHHRRLLAPQLSEQSRLSGLPQVTLAGPLQLSAVAIVRLT